MLRSRDKKQRVISSANTASRRMQLKHEISKASYGLRQKSRDMSIGSKKSSSISSADRKFMPLSLKAHEDDEIQYPTELLP